MSKSEAALDAWRHRPLQTRVTTYCESCKELKEDVKKRESWWLPLALVSCSACFTHAVDEARAEQQGIVYG